MYISTESRLKRGEVPSSIFHLFFQKLRDEKERTSSLANLVIRPAKLCLDYRREPERPVLLWC